MNTIPNPENRTPIPEKDSPDRPKRLLVADTDPGLCWSLDKGLRLSGYEVRTVETPASLLDESMLSWADCILMELLPEAGMDFNTLSAALAPTHAAPVVCTSIDPMPEMIIECMRRGATDFLAKPFGLAEVRRVMSEALERVAPPLISYESQQEPQTAPNSPLVGISPAMQELRSFISEVARTDLNCLIRGESGVGKDVVAREIHQLSQRRTKPFVKVNCTALPESLLESELFGYEKGAFTGAATAKPGRFSLANEGIIFLDEIGDMYPGLQAKILQVIEHKEFTPVGGTHSKQVDVQIIAATNADLEAKAAANEFRRDLYFRLNEISIWVPPLRDRKEDIPFLVRHFLQKHGKYTASGKMEITGEELEKLSKYAWPGNIRELENTIKRWFVLGKQMPEAGQWSTSPTPQKKIMQNSWSNGQPTQSSAPAPGKQQEPSSDEIRAALDKHRWNRKKTAEALGIGYQVLRRRIEKYQLTERE